jgi:hypothetical protein
MNERIRELVRQAGLDDADFPIENWDNVPLAKFAKLMIGECANIAYNTQYNHGRASYETSSCERAIKKHFGFEE